MGFSKRYKKKQKGGTPLQTGIDVKSIAAFNPITMSGLVLWIQATEENLKRTPVGEYAANQMPLIKLGLLDTYSANLTEPVITEITGHTNALQRLEAVEPMSTYFPILYESATGEPPGLDISAYKESANADTQSVTLMSRDPVELPEKYTAVVGGEGVAVEYNTTLDRIFVKAATVEGTPSYTTDVHGKTVRVPTALFRELLVFDRELTTEERETLDGYLAYRGNTQFLLPANHPYMPDMSSDPVLAVPVGQIDSVTPALHSALQRLKTDSDAYSAKVGQDSVTADYAKMQDRVIKALQELDTLRRLLSKGVLLARAKVKGMTYTLEDIYGILNSGALYKVPVNSAEIERQLKEAQGILQEAKDFLPRLAEADQKLARLEAAATTEKQTEERTEAETEERLRDVETQSRRKEFAIARRRIREEIDRLGGTLLAPHIEAYISELETTRDAFLFQEKQRFERFRTMETLLQPIRTSFADGSWLAEFSDMEPTDPTLKTLESIFQTIERASRENDIAYLNIQIDRITKESLAILESWLPRRSFSLFRHLYVAHLRQAYEQTERFMRFLVERIEKVEEATRQLLADMATLRRVKQVVPFKPELPKDSFLPLEPIYMARVSDADAALLCGYTHICTDKNGTPISRMNAAGDADVQFLFPEFMQGLSINPSASGSAYTYASGYIEYETKSPILQSLFVVPIQKESILGRLPPSRVPLLRSITLEESLSKPYEIPREYVNCIVRIANEGARSPVSLPKYAVRSEAFYCIQNTGRDAICVRNPGALEDSLDLVGPGEVRVYMYGEGTSLSSTPGFAYGHLPWQEGRLPYDTLLGTPRTSTAVFVTSLKTAIYCSPGPKPKAVLDSDGYFVPVVAAADGNVYDADDFALSSPYTVRMLPECDLDELIYDRHTAKGQVKTTKGATIETLKDTRTGAIILCSRSGVPAVDEFGVCKMALTPLLWADGSIKCKGSLEDLHIKPATGEIDQPYLYPEGLLFERVFRSEFCRAPGPVFTTGQGLPLVSPKGAFLLIPPNAAQVGDAYKFEEPRGRMNQAFLISKGTTLPPMNDPAEYVAFQPFDTVVAKYTAAEKSRRLLYRFIGGFEYSKGTPKRLQDASARIQTLGDTVTESIRSSIEQTIGMVEERLKEFSEFEETIGRVQRMMKMGDVPQDIAMTLDVLELKLRDKMLEIMKIVGTVEKPIENYEFLLERRAAATEFVRRMRVLGEDAFKKGYQAIQDLYRLYIERTKSISSPEMDATTAQLKEKEAHFLQAQDTLEALLAQQPDTVSEIREWLLNLQQSAAKQFATLQSIETLVAQQLLAKLGGAEEETKRLARAELETLRAQADEIRADAKRYAGLFEIREGPSEIQAPEKGALEKGPFVHLVSPSIEGELAPLLGKEAVVAIVEQGPTIATLWGTIRSKLVLPPTESVGAIALRGSVDAARTAITESRDACNQMKSRMAIPFEVYTNAANALLERQKAELQDSLRTIRGHAMELDSQRMAIVTATQSLGESLTEEEAAKVKGLREEVEGIAKRLTLESVQPEVLRIQPVLEGIQTNPFVVSAMQKGLERIVKMGDETVQAMRDRVEQFREFRQSLAERLTTVLDEQRRNLRDEYEMIRKSAVAEEIARLDREFEPGFQRIQSVSTNIPALLTAIGEVGRLRSLLTFTS